MVKTGVLQSPPPWNNTVLGVPIQRNTYPKFQNFTDLSHVHLFTLNFQDQAPRLPRASSASSQLSAHPQVKELCGYCPLYVPSLDSPNVNDVLHISNILLAASSLPAQFPLSLHAWNIS